MKAALALLALLSTAAAPADTGRVEGHYYLEGVMETGSELLLRPDGRFQFYLAYGALDLIAEGVWRAEERGDGRHVLLTAARPKPGYESVQAFKRLDLTVTRTENNEAALETVSGEPDGRRMLYVRHAPAQSDD